MAITFNFIQPPANTGTGLKIDTAEMVNGANTVERQIICIGDPQTPANVATVSTLGVAVSVADIVGATTALNALNAAATVATTSMNGCGVLIAGSGTLVGTLTPEISMDGGSTWQAALFYNPSPTAVLGVPANGIARTVTVSSPAASLLSILLAPGTSNARVRVSAFTSGTSNGTLRAVNAAPGTTGLLTAQLIDCGKNTYDCAISGLVTVTGATDVFTITGATGIVTRVLRARAAVTIQTAAQYVGISVIKRSTANSAGTQTTPTIAKHDPQAPAASSVVNAYTANPTLGTAAGVVDSARVFAPLTGTAALGNNPVEFNWGLGPQQGHILRAATDVLAINLNAPGNAGTGDFAFTFTEE